MNQESLAILAKLAISIDALTSALTLAIVARTLVAGLITPIFKRFKLDKFWLTYVAWTVSSGIVALGQVNVFGALIPSQIAGMILTCALVGGGSNVLHDFVSRLSPAKRDLTAK